MSMRQKIAIGLLALPLMGTALAQAPASNADAEAKLKAARERLEVAAREVAQLSAQLGDHTMGRVMRFERAERRAVLGVQVDPQSDRAGAKVRDVSPGGPAAQAGIQSGDVIVALNGKSLAGRDDSSEELLRQMRDIAPDQKVKVRVLRAGKPQDFTVMARARPADSFVFRMNPQGGPMPPLPPLSSMSPMAPDVMAGEVDSVFDFIGQQRGAMAGLELATLTAKLGTYFGAKQGVLVVRAPEKSPYRLEDGDVIESIDGRVPNSGSHALRILRSYQPGEKLQLKILRQRQSMTLEATLPERADDGSPNGMRS
jgi:S1-C subfamily serine protease